LVLHFADAPCHGVKYSGYEKKNDNYPEGVKSKDIPYEDIFYFLKEMKIHYYFFKLSNETDLMMENFQEIYNKVKTVDKEDNFGEFCYEDDEKKLLKWLENIFYKFENSLILNFSSIKAKKDTIIKKEEEIDRQETFILNLSSIQDLELSYSKIG
jgi:hypothetical protein